MSGPRDLVLAPEYQGLKRASAALVRAAGGQEAAAAEVGKARSRLSDYGSVNTADFMPIDVVLGLEAVTHGLPGYPLVTACLARASGHVLVALPDVGRIAGGDLTRAIAAHAEEAGQATSAALETIATLGGRGAGVRARAVRELTESIEASVRLRALIQEGDG